MASLNPSLVTKLVRELRAVPAESRPLSIAGAPALAGALRKELERDAAAGAVREGFDRSAAALVYVLAAETTADDLAVLREAEKARMPVAALLAGPELDPRVPGVLATSVVVVEPGHGFPVEEIADALARRLGDRGPGLAARIPALRPAVARALTERYARRNGVLGAAIFIPGADLPVLTVNQVRLVFAIGTAYGVPTEAERLPAGLGVLGGAFAFRAVARQAAAILPLAGWAVKGGVAYAATRAVGEAAQRYFEGRAATPSL
jgi:uncharacterized protein (DUF697 family)